MITISGVVSGFGGTNGAGDKFQEKIPSFSDNVTLIKGGHTMKFGVGFQKNNDTQLADVYTQFTFPTLAAYTAAKNGTNTQVLHHRDRPPSAGREPVTRRSSSTFSRRTPGR